MRQVLLAPPASSSGIPPGWRAQAATWRARSWVSAGAVGGRGRPLTQAAGALSQRPRQETGRTSARPAAQSAANSVSRARVKTGEPLRCQDMSRQTEISMAGGGVLRK